MASTTLAYKSSLKISSLSRTIDSVNKIFGNVQETTGAIADTLTKQGDQKRKTLSDSNKFFLARREAVRKREQESIIEASSLGGAIRRTGKVVMDSTKGFLGRILDFAGTLLVGWLLLNLPRIIDGAKKLIERMQKLVTTLGNVVTNVTDILFTFGSTLGGVLTDIATFNFGGIKDTVLDGMNKMNQSIMKLEQEVLFGINLLTRPLDFGFDLDEIPEGQPQGPEGTYTPGGIDGPEVSGGRVNPQAVYQYLRSKGVSHIHALGILANIQGESGFQIGVTEKGGSKQGIGLFQYTFPSRKNAFLQAVPDYKTNWKGQVDFAIGVDANTPIYLRKQFATPEQAADDWMRNWENPDPAVYSTRRKVHNDFIKAFKTPQAGKTGSVKLGGRLSKEQNISGMVAPGGGVNAVVTSLYDPKGLRGRKHGGLDIAAPRGTYIALKVDGQIMGTRNNVGGYGLVIDIWVPAYGVQLRFGHCDKIIESSGYLPAGKSFATVGSTGRSTGPHIHFEYTKEYNSSRGGSDGDPSPYVPLILLTRGISSAGNYVSSTKPSAAQISVLNNKQTAQKIATERKGEEVVVIRRQQKGEPMSPASVIATGTNMIPGGRQLNTFIKDVLFLNLANS